MGSLEISHEEIAGNVVLRLSGTLNGLGALELRKSLSKVRSDQTVVLDFSRVREFYDLALPAVICALEDHKVQLQGLAVHQERMFRYLGVKTAEGSERSYYRPEEVLSA